MMLAGRHCRERCREVDPVLQRREPKRMAGEVSEGMLFDIGYVDGLPPALATPERAVPSGARAG